MIIKSSDFDICSTVEQKRLHESEQFYENCYLFGLEFQKYNSDFFSNALSSNHYSFIHAKNLLYGFSMLRTVLEIENTNKNKPVFVHSCHSTILIILYFHGATFTLIIVFL